MKKIAPYKTGIDVGNAYWMALLANIVYLKTAERDEKPDERRILQQLKQQDAEFISVFGVDKNSAQAALIEHKDYLCMTFRGTNEISDWLDNIDAFATKKLFGEFHRGFWNCVDDVWQPLDNRLKELRQARMRPLFLTGHSLGGAMASIAAARLIDEDRPFSGVYTFGQPRAMARDTARTFNMECKSRYFRFHNNNDIVTRVPARMMGYSHVGSYYYISEEKMIHPEAGFWFKFVDAIDGALTALRQDGIDAVEDHDMRNYLEAICHWNLVSQ